MTDQIEPTPVVTEIAPDTEKKLSEIARVASERQKPRPGYGAFGVLCAFLAIGMFGIIFLYQEGVRARVVACERNNVLRAKLAEIILSAEAGSPAERYTAEAKAFYDKAFEDLALVDCTAPAKSIPTPSFPERPPRQVGEAPPRPPPEPPSPLAGARGEPGGQGATGLPGPSGPPGRDGAAGRDGTVVVMPTTAPAATTTTVPPSTTTTTPTTTTTTTTIAPAPTAAPSLFCLLLRLGCQ